MRTCLDPQLQRAHRRFPWMVTWDDHEVQNDYAGLRGRLRAVGLDARPAPGAVALLGLRPLERPLEHPRQQRDDGAAGPRRPGSPVVGTELVGTSISSNGDGAVYGPYYGPMIKFNPHIKFFDGDRRGYQSCHVDRHRFRTDLEMVRTVSRPDAAQYTFASFEVQDGRPGAHRV
jgi:phosphodiesterase/alkaline phosphatase D-like protein